MSDILDEQLSAFLDGELPPEEVELLLKRLDREPERRATLGRYAMISECLRTGHARLEALPVGERVRTELLGAPLGSASGGEWRRRGWVAGFGLAAAMAIVAFLVQTVVWRGPGFSPVARNESAADASRDDGISMVNAAVSRRLDPQSAARLTSYLVAHGEYANQFSRNNFDSYLVTARAERAAWRQGQGPDGVR